MKKFNINDYIYIQITEIGWEHLNKTVGAEYIERCINSDSYKKEINGEIWHRLQAHSVWELLPLNFSSNVLYKTTIMFDDISLT